jgi:hypothetical protein
MAPFFQSLRQPARNLCSEFKWKWFVHYVLQLYLILLSLLI